MRILIDMQGDQTDSHYRGIGRFVRELVKALPPQYPEYRFILHFDSSMPAAVCRWQESAIALSPNVEISRWSMPRGVDRHLFHHERWRGIGDRLYAAAIERAAPDIILIPSFFESEAVVNLSHLDPAIPRVVLMHDLIPLVNQREYLNACPETRADYLRRVEEVKKADHLVCNSAFTAREAVEWLDIETSRTTPIWADADARFRPDGDGETQSEALLHEYGVEGPFVLHTGAVDPRKNVDLLIQAFGRLPAAVQATQRLVLAGPISGAERDALAASARRHGVPADALVVLGHVSDELLVALYNGCSAFVFPSRHEGFGLPALEAMRCGAPVLAANATSLVEVVADEAALFDPDDPQALAEKLERVLTDPEWRAERLAAAQAQAERFSWDRTATLTMGVLEHLVSAEDNPRRRADPTKVSDRDGKPRLAFVSPLPPAHTGIANYSEELLPALAEHYDVTLVTDEPVVSDTLIEAFGQPLDPDGLREAASTFDRVLYQVGNSPFHSFMADLMDAVPGVVVMHDACIGGLWFGEPAQFQTPIDGAGEGAPWAQAVRVSHGVSAVADALGMTRSEFIDQYPASWPIIERARGVIVHSRHARELFERHYAPDAAGHWAVIPHLRALPQEADRDAARERLGLAPDAFIIASFGMVAPTKRCKTLLEAWMDSRLAGDHRCQLVFAGPLDLGEYGAALMEMASSPGAGNVRFTDRLTDEAFADWLAAADVAVQLRGESRGETSGAVSHAMAHGLPVLVNMHGSMAELPDDAVYKIDDPIESDVLIRALETLYDDAELRERLGRAARALIATDHAPAACAAEYSETLERAYARNRCSADGLVDALDAEVIQRLGEADQERLATAIATTLPIGHPRKRLFVDVTATAATDRMTGIERVALRLVESWLADPPEGFRIEPVRLVESEGEWRYVTAMDWMRRITGDDLVGLGDEVVDPGPGDVLGIVDISGQQLVEAVDSGLHQQLRADGCPVFAIVYDILPVTHPRCFPPGADATHQRWLEAISAFDGIFGISQTVRNNARGWLSENRPERVGVIKTGHFALGTDHIATSEVGDEPPPNLELPTDRRLFITVGTIEPRKRHHQVLDAFECRWAAGSTDCLVIVGKEGWQELPDSHRRDIPETVKRLTGHRELGQRLFWLDGLSDSELDTLYHQATGLIAASEDEGYGLPVVEAAARGMPILARDIPVFREVAPAGTQFFSAMDGETLAYALQMWMTEQVVDSAGAEPVAVLWRDSARELWSQVAGIATN
ncbi:glycosyltransferase [Spiribacter insolitus]|uniref:Glycosyltransferase n=1 Tax=Spiribacter insolitus TaxID=3122417 RepID=A0ABV3T908_9GAMM